MYEYAWRLVGLPSGLNWNDAMAEMAVGGVIQRLSFRPLGAPHWISIKCCGGSKVACIVQHFFRNARKFHCCKATNRTHVTSLWHSGSQLPLGKDEDTAGIFINLSLHPRSLLHPVSYHSCPMLCGM